MAKYLLWFAVIFIIVTALFTKDEVLSLFSKSVMWGSIWVLAICESIEKISKQ